MSVPSNTNTEKAVQLVLREVQKCVEALNVEVHDLQYGIFKRWLKNENPKMGTKQLHELQELVSSVGGWQTLKLSSFMTRSTPAESLKVEMRSDARVARKALTALAHHDIFERRIEELFARQPLHVIKPFGYSFNKKPVGDTGRILNLLLSDLHFGSWLEKNETDNKYTYIEEARRTASIIKRVCEFKRDHRDETELVVWLLGDLMKGIIHDLTGGKSLAEQTADAAFILKQALTILAGEFRKVTVLCTGGNHDRNTVYHVDRATAGKWNNFATNIYFGLRMAMEHVKNVQFVIPRTPYVEHHPFGGKMRVYGTHGDSFLNPGNPGKSINIASLESQMLKINDGEAKRGKSQYGLFVVGHVHTASLTHLPSGTLITNGALVPPDAYARSVGYSTSICGQYMWESTPHRLLGDSRFLEVDESIDKDADLDLIIKPWDGQFSSP